MFRFQVTHFNKAGPARVGHLDTARGPVETPAFMPVGTRGTVKATTGVDVWLTGARLMLANTYHLMLRPGADAVAALGGVHAFSGFEGPMLTDSGGFQAFSLAARMDDDGMTLKSTYDGSAVRLTPEEAVRVQLLLGADIAMVLDDCPALPATAVRLEEAVARTTSWAQRCRAAHPDVERQALFGIVQGGLDDLLRAKSAAEIAAIGFDGYAIGGLSLGETREETAAVLTALEPHLPLDAPRYLMGVGDPLGILMGVEAGIDLFDSVWPARLARHGHLLTPTGRLSIKPATHALDAAPIEEDCPCEACRSFARGVLRHLFMVHDPAAARLLTLHNLTFLGRFTARLRAAIRDGRLEEEAAVIRTTWNAATGG